jgi:hypothetical protein
VQSRPQTVPNLPLNDPEEFPSASSHASFMTGMGWAGYRPSSNAPSSLDSFPSLPQTTPGLVGDNYSSQGRVVVQSSRRPLRPVKHVVGVSVGLEETKRLNQSLIAKMKSMVGDHGVYKRFKAISKDFLTGNGVKASDFLTAFCDVFNGLDGATQDILEELIALLPDEQKRQALHLVYRHEADRLRSNPPR